MGREAFTQLELLVALTIVGLLSAVGLSAVQRAREASRRTQCVNNLRQIGLAMHSFQAQQGVFPASNSHPFRDLAEAIGLPYQRGEGRHPTYDPVFRCPEELNHPYLSSPSYRLNDGLIFFEGTEYRPCGGGYLGDHRRPADFTDGLSVTAAYSEKLIPPTGALKWMANHPDRLPWWTRQSIEPRAVNRPEFVSECLSGRISPFPSSIAMFGMSVDDQYDHSLPPNRIGCWNGPPEEWRLDTVQMTPASSLHPGGVNVLFADGHVSFISDSIALEVWQALGTIAGEEVLLDQY